MHRYVRTKDETYGPADEKHLAVWLREGRIGPDDWVWVEEEDRWITIRSLFSLGPAPVESVPVPAPTAAPTRAAASSAPENAFAFEEARRYVRFETQLLGSYAYLKGEKPPEADDYRPCTVLNLSMGGAGVVTAEKIVPGSVVRLVIPRIDDESEPFGANAKVIRTAPAIQDGSGEYGLKFAALTASAQMRLAVFIDGQTARKGGA